MTNQLTVKTQRLVSLIALVILLAVAPVAVGQSVQGSQQTTGATPTQATAATPTQTTDATPTQLTGAVPTYGPGSDNRPVVRQEARPTAKSDPPPSAAAVRDAGTPGAAPETRASLRPTKLLKPGTFQLHVEKNDFGLPFISLKANKARAAEIAVALERELKTSVILSPLMKQLRATVDFDDVPLQTALGLIAPDGYIDTGIVTGKPGEAPLLVEIYLGAANEPPPPPSGAAKSVGPQAFFIAGNTEDPRDNPALEEAKKRFDSKDRTVEAVEDDNPIVVKYNEKTKLITVRANKAPVTGVLYQIAEKLGIVFELGTIDPDIKVLSEVVDKNLNEYTVLDALRALSPDVVIYMRTDIHGVEPVPMRLALDLPPAMREKLEKPEKQVKASAEKSLQNQ